jgi:signal peptidase
VTGATEGTGTRGGSAGRRLGDAALTLASVGGVVCIALVIAASVFHVTLIMFKTGSMSPTIPAGSLAVVREIPAAEARVGDVLTIARPGELPITHRVTSVTPVDGGLTSITMKGDANDFEDPAPYTVDSARIVLYSVPWLANAVVAVSHPVALGSITLAAALLVSWAFWPRAKATAKPQHGRRRGVRDPQRRTRSADRGHGAGRRHGHGTGAAGAAVLVLALAVAPTFAAPASPAQAAEGDDGATETTVTGRYLTLVSIHDPDQLGSLAPGKPVPWQVGVTVRAPEPGTVHIGISAEGELTDPGELDLDVRACPERWVDGVCAQGESLWLPRQDLAAAVAPVPTSMDNPDGAREIGQMRSATSWLMLRVVMPVSLEPGSAANLRLHAWGSGDEVVLGDSGAGTGIAAGAGLLAFTGFHGGLPLAVAAVALALGGVLAASARRRRASRG